MSKFIKFIEKALTSGSGTSSKRLNGTIGYTVGLLILLFISIYDMIADGELAITTIEIIKVNVYTSAALLGLGILDKFKQV